MTNFARAGCGERRGGHIVKFYSLYIIRITRVTFTGCYPAVGLLAARDPDALSWRKIQDSNLWDLSIQMFSKHSHSASMRIFLGGIGGIRTREPLARLLPFQRSPVNHLGTIPSCIFFSTGLACVVQARPVRSVLAKIVLGPKTLARHAPILTLGNLLMRRDVALLE